MIVACPQCTTPIREGARFCATCGSPASPLSPLTPGTGGGGPAPALPPRYQIVKFLGRGGMGRVYLCRDADLDVDVAVKVLPPELAADEESLQQIQKEARAAARLRDCPGILSLHAFESFGDTRYLVMEFAEGGSLHDRLKKGGRIPEAECRRIGAEVAEALAFAHERKILHRDIKPANVLLDGRGRARVADFGIAKVMADTSARMSLMTVAGTPIYMAPEIVLQRKADRRADLYSLGCMLFEMSTGERPFQGAYHEVMAMKMTPGARPPDPRERNPDLGEDFSACVRCLLDPDPDRRFPDGEACARALRGQGMGGAPVAASSTGIGAASPPTLPLGPTVSRPRRGRAVALVISMTVVAALGAGAWSWWEHQARVEHAATVAAARAALEKGDFGVARAEVERAARGDREPEEVGRVRAEIARREDLERALTAVGGSLKQWDLEAAQNGIARAEGLGKDDPRVASLRADLDRRRSFEGHIRDSEACRDGWEIAKAEDALGKAVALFPDEPRATQARAALGRLRAAAGSLAEARRALESGDLPRARTLVDGVRTEFPKASAVEALHVEITRAQSVKTELDGAKSALAGDRLADARKGAGAVLGMQPGSAEAKAILAEVDRREGLAKALASIRAALDANDSRAARAGIDAARGLGGSAAVLDGFAREATDLETRPRYQALLLKARGLLEAKDLDGADAALAEADGVRAGEKETASLRADIATARKAAEAATRRQQGEQAFRKAVASGDLEAARKALEDLRSGGAPAETTAALEKELAGTAGRLALRIQAGSVFRFAGEEQINLVGEGGITTRSATTQGAQYSMRVESVSADGIRELSLGCDRCQGDMTMTVGDNPTQRHTWDSATWRPKSAGDPAFTEDDLYATTGTWSLGKVFPVQVKGDGEVLDVRGLGAVFVAVADEAGRRYWNAKFHGKTPYISALRAGFDGTLDKGWTAQLGLLFVPFPAEPLRAGVSWNAPRGLSCMADVEGPATDVRYEVTEVNSSTVKVAFRARDDAPRPFRGVVIFGNEIRGTVRSIVLEGTAEVRRADGMPLWSRFTLDHERWTDPIMKDVQGQTTRTRRAVSFRFLSQ